MNVYGKAAISEFLGDFVVYRKLVPADSRLSGLEEIRDQVGLPKGRLPRKSEPAYARVIVHLLRQAQRLHGPEIPIERLVYVGDTRLNDGTAFSNLCQFGQWSGLAFIGAETTEAPHFEIVQAPRVSGVDFGDEGETPLLFLASRWALMADFDRFCADRGFPVDGRTAVVIDLDKTALGARGRNAQVIDQARVLAVRNTVAELLGEAFDAAVFQVAYDQLNQPEFHSFTADNQDYLAYICLILGSGLYDLNSLITDVRAGTLVSYRQFIAEVDRHAEDLTSNLNVIHAEIYANTKAGDPTPFKSFRFNEYRTTIGCMGHMPDDSPVEELLGNEIVITQEVRAQALEWRARGALLFGLSDKPDEASVPSLELADQGYQAIHRTETHAVGF